MSAEQTDEGSEALSFPHPTRLRRATFSPEGRRTGARLMKGTTLHRKNSSRARDFARGQREEPTRAEMLFWQAVRNRRFAGLKFKRQMAIGPFVADFCCFEYKLIVELDGEPHETLDARTRDAVRTTFLKAEGYQVLRFSNERVLGNLEFVLRKIAAFLDLAGLPSSDPASPGHLLPRGEKG
ncbi:putative Ribonuclease P [Hyphomicrobiales bacterium]|nr:putative Ribonuclease P [Hyphomicrobiales bacterium]CAH1699965.1 putative Ribonuclease P [Hyphomicrobiales bacterium]CAI0343723.1 ribonuclease P protein component [Hyphomicrobiales bacterium]